MPEKITSEEESCDIQFEGGGKGCESDEVCCLCIPLKTGVTLIAILNVLWAVLTLITLFGSIYGGSLKFIVLICILPSFVADFFFLRWLMDDTKETRENLPRAALLQMLAAIAVNAWTLIMFVVIANYDGVSNTEAAKIRLQQSLICAGNCLVSLIIWYYFLVKLKIFAANL